MLDFVLLPMVLHSLALPADKLAVPGSRECTTFSAYVCPGCRQTEQQLARLEQHIAAITKVRGVSSVLGLLAEPITCRVQSCSVAWQQHEQHQLRGRPARRACAELLLFSVHAS